MTKATNNVARVAAGIAGLGLVLGSFAPLAGAQTTTTTTTTTTSATFTRDLTIGSTGADVTALQTWLIAKGFSIPAGATGYFGAQTKAALAAFQAANAITPAAGYFGPITRAKVAAMGGSTTTGGDTSGSGSTSGLSGGEATFRNFELNSGDDLSQGDSNKEIAVAKFDVRGGDVSLQRITVSMQPTLASGSANQHPWSYLDTLSVYDGSKKIGSVDVSSKSDWDQESASSGSDFASGYDYYTIDIPVNDIVKESDNNELSIRATAQDTIDTGDTDQTFNMVVPTDGIRAVDAKGIQEYTGSSSTGNTVTVGFNAAQNGKLNVTTSSDNPKAGVIVADDTNTSDSYDVLAFSIKNSQDAGVDFNTLTFTATSASSTVKSIVRRATLDLNGDTYTGTIGTGTTTTIVFNNLNTSMSGNDTIDGTLSVELYGQSGHFAASGENLTFALTSGNVDAESSDTGDASTVSGSATGKTQSIGVNAGITVASNSNSTSEAYNSTTPSNSTGSFTLKFDVTANGSDDVYIPKTIATVASTSSNTSAGVAVSADLVAGSSASSTAVSLSSTADTDPDNSGYYIVRAGDTETFTANVTIDATAAGYFQVGLRDVNFTTVSTGGSLQNLALNPVDNETSQLYIH